MTWETKRECGEFFKNSAQSEKIVARVADLEGRIMADVRVMYLNSQGEWTPTKRGICVPVAMADDLAELTRMLAEATGEFRVNRTQQRRRE